MKLTLLIIFLSCISLFAIEDIKVIKSDNSSIIFEFTPIYLDTTIKIIDGSSYRFISYRNGNVINEEDFGTPRIESRIVNIGVPKEFGNTLEVLSYNYKELNGNLPPNPEIKFKENEVTYLYKTNQQYFSLIKSNLVEFGEFVLVRGLPVQKLEIRPIEFDANTSKIKLYTSITVKVNFAREQKHFIQEYTDDLLKDVVLNYDAAKDWIESKPKSLSKAAVTNSVLSSGRFFRFEAPEEGIYRIDRAALASLGIDAGSVDPRTIKIYNNGGKAPVPENMLQSRSADLTENAIYVRGEEDGKFDEGDYILFYGRGIHFWDYDTTEKQVKRYFHPFTIKNYYYITSGGNSGKRVEQKPAIEAEAEFQQSTTKAYYAKEDDLVNLLKSGRVYLGDMFTESANSKERVYMSKLDGIVENSSIEYKFVIANRAERAVPMEIWENQNRIFNGSIGGLGIGNLESYGNRAIYYKGQASFTGTLPESRSSLKFVYNATHSPSQGYLDYYEIYYDKHMAAVSDEVKFYSRKENIGVSEYLLNGFVNNTSEVKVFDVSDHANVKMISGAMISGGECRFKVNESSEKITKYIAAGQAALKSIISIEEVPNQDLHGISDGAKFIIITPRLFLQEALRLETHKETKEKEPISTIVVTVDQIYNEFSTTGSQDVSAIRDFIKYAFDNWAVKPEYVLLFGDGDYDYKNTEGKSQNFILAYESAESYNLINSYSSDDFFGRISGNDMAVDIAVGRLNILSDGEAKNVVDKIIKYETQKDFTLWRNTVTLVADDNIVASGKELNLHTPQSEDLALNHIPPFLDRQKIYITQYPTVETGSGRRKPTANSAIVKAINDGTLILNYIGHGNPDVWAHEHVFEKPTTIPQLRNDKYFFLSAATCDFGRYDVPGEQSSTEIMMVKPDGGSIGTFTSSRAVFSTDNASINNKFFDYMFTKQSDGLYNPVGKSYFLTKNFRAMSRSYEMINDMKFHYFGDPTIRLNVAEMAAEIDSINNQSLLNPIQIQALSTVKVYGTIRNGDGNIADGFNGEGILTFFDSERLIELKELGSSMREQGGVLFRSRVGIESGRFLTEFTVPKDISYENKNGKVVILANDGTNSAVGFTTNVIIGGADTTKVNDGKGPAIVVSFDGEESFGTSMIGPNSGLQIKLSDETGLNTTGTGIGHRLEGILNDDDNKSIDFTNYFIGDLNSGGKSGVVDYRFNQLDNGEYKIKIKAWDVFNNSSEVETYFSVVQDDDLVIRDLFNYPNPFSSNTSFTFQLNLSDIIARVKIYTVTGRLIKELEHRTMSKDIVKIDWDGRDEDGNSIANGTYLYKLIVTTPDGKFKKELLGKLAVIR